METTTVEVEGPDRSYRLHCTLFGDSKATRSFICVHGLTRNCRDFDALAAALSPFGRVICPDMAGRGQSDWLDDPAAYGVPTYASHMLQLMAHFGIDDVDWIGTSMGGLIGLALAAMETSPIRKLVLNDVGPVLPSAALNRIGSYVGLDPEFADLQGLEAHLRAVHAPFGPLHDDQWAHLARHSARATANGRFRLAYDPRIALPFKTASDQPVDLWDLWDKIACEVLVLRGAASDLLLSEVADAMQRRGPKAELLTFEGVGHAPALMADDQIKTVVGWLCR